MTPGQTLRAHVSSTKAESRLARVAGRLERAADRPFANCVPRRADARQDPFEFVQRGKGTSDCDRGKKRRKQIFANIEETLGVNEENLPMRYRKSARRQT